MTPNGVRTAGIALLVRMDDPLTPADQVAIGYENEDICIARNSMMKRGCEDINRDYDNDADIEEID